MLIVVFSHYEYNKKKLLPRVPIIDVDDGDVHSGGVVLTAIRSHNPNAIFSKPIMFQLF